MGKLGASILAADLACLARRVKLAEQDADLIHVDLMDAHLVSTLTIGRLIESADRELGVA